MKTMQWVFTADKITIRQFGQKDDTELYTLDSSKKPKEIETMQEQGDPKVGLYNLEGDVLKLCFSSERDEPPKELAADEAGMNVLWTFRRVATDNEKPKEDKSKDDAKVKKLLDDWCEVTKVELDARMQEFQAGKIVQTPVLSAAQRLFKAEVERSKTKADRLAAYEDYLRRITDVAGLAKKKLEAGKIAIADVDETESYRLEAEFLLEREKAK